MRIRRIFLLCLFLFSKRKREREKWSLSNDVLCRLLSPILLPDIVLLLAPHCSHIFIFILLSKAYKHTQKKVKVTMRNEICHAIFTLSRIVIFWLIDGQKYQPTGMFVILKSPSISLNELTLTIKRGKMTLWLYA